MKPLIDRFGRRIDYLRISVTDRCTLRCRYCVPASGVRPLDPSQILSFEEIQTIAKAAIRCGITKIRLTGGEPLVRKEITELVRTLARLEGLGELSMTTNGTILPTFAEELKASGLSRLNISLDTLNRDKFSYLTRRDELPSVLKGIDMAIEVGFSHTKINVVVLRGINDDEIEDLAKLSLERPLHVRFIEYMPFSEGSYFYPLESVFERLLRLGPLEPVGSPVGNGPARYFSYDDAPGKIGLIGYVSQGFCNSCNRLRLTANGKLRSCLTSRSEIDLKDALRCGGSDYGIDELLFHAVRAKSWSGDFGRDVERSMVAIGG